KQCVAAGMGLAVLPCVAVERELASGQLAGLRWAGPPIEVVTQMVWHSRRWQSPGLREFLRLGSELLRLEKAGD
ncbi:MAG TPA: LysR family transcriptional regulator substrate-binding protein, partial [Roseiflexaceae bacterium]|nr:LysR family transcriptional regulator substrate-binding protein [Roseiflexaceae bacterium]